MSKRFDTDPRMWQDPTMWAPDEVMAWLDKHNPDVAAFVREMESERELLENELADLQSKFAALYDKIDDSWNILDKAVKEMTEQ